MIKYLDEMNFYKNKCKISEELAEVFRKSRDKSY